MQEGEVNDRSRRFYFLWIDLIWDMFFSVLFFFIIAA